MKIISGSLKGRIIKGYDIEGTRPTMDRVKESLFGMIQTYISDKVVLDLFAGTGNLGFEAISNGAKLCIFNDKNKKCTSLIKENINIFNIESKAVVLNLDCKKALEYIKENKLSIVAFLKSFPRKKRIDVVDILRGALPIPIDYKELKLIGKTLNMPDEEVYNMWEQRIKQVLESAGMNVYANSGLLTSMLDCARNYLLNSK